MDMNRLKAALTKRKELVETQISSTWTATSDWQYVDKSHPASSGGSDAVTESFYSGKFLDKSITGLVGLQNLGATCFLNSFLQSLYYSVDFRIAVLNYKPDDFNNKSDIILALQKLFLRLCLTNQAAVSTSQLTTAFGWRSNDYFTQHDVQELYIQMFDMIQQHYPTSELATVCATKYTGQSIDYVECKKCGFKRERNDNFLDISLVVTGNFHSSLLEYIKPEVIDGYNCFQCQSKQQANKGIKFTNFPVYLTVQLKRFQMNWETGQRIKLNTPFSFPPQFDANQYINTVNYGNNNANSNNTNNNNNENTNEYELFSINLHTGGALAGHYFSYIKDFQSGKWYEFNDHQVTELSEDNIKYIFRDLEQEKKQKQLQEQQAASENKNNNNNKTNTNMNGESSHAANFSAVTAAINKKVTFVDPSTNAYLLIYKQVSSTKPDQNKVNPNNCVNKSLLDEIETENAKFVVDKAEYNRLQALFRLQIHYNNVEYRVEVKKTDTLIQALQTILNELNLSNIDINNARLRRWDHDRKSCAQPFNESQLNSVISESPLKFHNFQHLGLETKEQNAEFEKWTVPQLPLRYCIYNADSNNYNDPIDFSVDELGARVADVRAALATKLNYAPNQLLFSIQNGKDIKLLLNETHELQADLAIVPTEIIYVELLNTPYTIPISVNEQKALQSTSKMILLHQDKQSIIKVHFVDFTNKNSNNEVRYTCSIDTRKPLLLLKEYISKTLNVGINEFKMKKSVNDVELKDLNKSIQSYGIIDDMQIYCELGKPMNAGERIFKFYLVSDKPITQQNDQEIKETVTTPQSAQSPDIPLAPSFDNNHPNNNDNTSDSAPPIAPPLSNSNIPDAPIAPPDAPPTAPLITSPSTPSAPTFRAQSAPVMNNDNKPDAIIDEYDFTYLGELVLHDDLTITEAKQLLFDKFNSAGVLDANKLRIREKIGFRLGKVFYDNKTIGQNAGNARDGKELAIQLTETHETLTEQHILVNLQQFFPSTLTLGKSREIALEKTMRIESLKLHIAKLYELPDDSVRVVKPRVYQMKDVNIIQELDWFGSEIGSETKLNQNPWNTRDGDTILWKDNRDKLTKPDKKKTNANSNISIQRPVETGIKFYSASEQAARDLAAKLQAEKDKEEQARLKAESAERIKLGLSDPLLDAQRAEQLVRDQEAEQARLEAIQRIKLAGAYGKVSEDIRARVHDVQPIHTNNNNPTNTTTSTDNNINNHS